jgi:hypothetical protein
VYFWVEIKGSVPHLYVLRLRGRGVYCKVFQIPLPRSSLFLCFTLLTPQKPAYSSLLLNGDLKKITRLLFLSMALCGHWPIHSFLAHGTLRSVYKPFSSAPIVRDDAGYCDNVGKDQDIENWLRGSTNRTGSIKVRYRISSPWPNQLKPDPQSRLPSPARLRQLRKPSRGARRPLPDLSKKSSSHFPPALQLVQ